MSISGIKPIDQFFPSWKDFGRSKKFDVAFPSWELKNKHMQVSLSLATMLWKTLENDTRCSFMVIVKFPENLGKWSLDFGNGWVASAKFKGGDTC